ncbi:MAG: ThuA domain-containing protein [Planctomycetaceae bacterium]|jgi:type 1 glutamine amidotransferase|nr:ThuA domain-containing protein [Planctomycetaceae bacterium]
MMKRFFLNMFVCLTVISIFVILTVNNVFSQEIKKAKVLHFARSQGFEHGPAKLLENGTTISGNALKKYLAAQNIELVETQDGRLFDGDISQYDAFTFYTSGNLEEEKGSKNEAAHAISAEGLKKLIETVRSGKGFVGIHSATDTHCKQKNETGIDLYTAFVGARFAAHGPQQVATAFAVQPIQIPWVKMLPDGKDTVHEEWYAMKQYNKDLHVVLVQQTEGMKGDPYNRPPFPSTWIRMEGKGRVAYATYGHDNKFWDSETNLKKYGDLIEWSVGRYELDTTPNLDNVTPNAEQLPPPQPKPKN